MRADRTRPAAAAALAVVAVCAAGVWVLWQAFVVHLAGRRVDQVAMLGARHGQVRLWQYAERVLDPVSVAYGVVALAVVVGIGVLRRRVRLAVQAAVLLGGAMASTQLLKKFVLTRPDLGDLDFYGNTMPSGHTTAAAAFSAALLFVVGPRWRPPVAVAGAGYVLLTGWATMIGQWHRPSDVVAAILVVTAWSALASAAMLVRPHPAPTPTTALPVVATSAGGALGAAGSAGRRAGWAPAGVVIGGVAVLAAAVVLAAGWGGHGVPSTRGQLVAYAGAVLGIGGTATLAAAVQLWLRDACGRAAGVLEPDASAVHRS